MSRVDLQIPRSVEKQILSRLEKLGISWDVYWTWHQHVEVELNHRPSELLKWVHDERCHQFASIFSADKRLFRVTWLIDWSRGATHQRFAICDCMIAEKDPQLARNHNTGEHRGEGPNETDSTPPVPRKN